MIEIKHKIGQFRYWVSKKRESNLLPWKLVFKIKDFYDKAKIRLGQKRERILITGCGRSGTTYIATLLTKAGLPIGHEKMAKFGIACWPFVFNSREIPPYTSNLRFSDYKYKIILHQVRNPLEVIKSFHTIDLKSPVWEYIEKYVPINEEDSKTLRCMKYWYYWNLEAEKISNWTYKVEEIPDIFETLCEKIQHPELVKKKYICNKLNTNINTRRNNLDRNIWKIEWEDLKREDSELCKKIKHLAIKYGYYV